MDHHCPWLNNCVGHWNHRHFFLYMAWMIAGCAFVMAFGFEIMWEEVFAQGSSDSATDQTHSSSNSTKEMPV